MDGYQALRAFLPPKERRGLVFIDSSFDRTQEFKRLTEGLVRGSPAVRDRGCTRFGYPLMEPTAMRAFERGAMATGIRQDFAIGTLGDAR